MSRVALRLLAFRENLRIAPDLPASTSGMNPLELSILQAQSKKPISTHRDVALAIGRLGGHMNRKSDGMAGLLTLWRGWKRLQDWVEGARLYQAIL